MSHGLKVYNNSGEIQIDGTYKNFSFHESGTWNVSSGSDWYTFTPTINPPIVAIRPPGTYCLAAQYKKNANSEYYATKVGSDGSISLPYIVFTEAEISEIPNGAYGLTIYNANGNLLFHNYNKWCCLVSDVIFTNPMGANCNNNNTVDITVIDADNNYFIMRPLCEHGAYNFQQNITQFRSPLMKKVDSTTIRVSVVNTGGVFGDSSHCYSSSDLNLIEVAI